jgi:ankyrin repeat protein
MLWLKGADSNKKNDDGMTPAMKHSSNNREDLALFLVRNGADATFRDNAGNTLLHYAVRQNHITLANILLGDGTQFEIDNRPYNSVALCVFDIANQCAETPALLSRASNQQMRYLMEQYILLYLCKAFINKRYYTILDFLYKYNWINKDPFFKWIEEYYPENIEGFRDAYEKIYGQFEVKTK